VTLHSFDSSRRTAIQGSNQTRPFNLDVDPGALSPCSA
jgi:hypothetical protein